MSPDVRRVSHDAIARGELRLFDELGALSQLTIEERCQLLALSEGEWLAWHGFLGDGPRPAWPRLPDMLVRLASAAYRVASRLEPDPMLPDAAW
jgi:hypothetical protein